MGLGAVRIWDLLPGVTFALAPQSALIARPDEHHPGGPLRDRHAARLQCAGRGRLLIGAGILRLFYGCSYMFHLPGDNSRDRYIKGSWQGP